MSFKATVIFLQKKETGVEEKQCFSAFYLPTLQLTLIFFNLQTKSKRPRKVKSHLLTHNHHKQGQHLLISYSLLKNYAAYYASLYSLIPAAGSVVGEEGVI